jgi:hypothetical protein
MPGLLRRIRCLRRRRSHQNSRTNIPVDPLTQNDSAKQSEEYVDDDGVDQEHSKKSFSLLPTIKDSGPPTVNRYSDADIFWNSTMIEADDNSEKRRSATEGLRRDPLRPDNFQLSSRAEAESGNYGRSGTQYTGMDRTERRILASDSVASGTAIAQDKGTDIPGLRRLGRDISYGKERADNDLTIMFYIAPENTELLVASPPSRTPHGSLPPGLGESVNHMEVPIVTSADPRDAVSQLIHVFEDRATPVTVPLDVMYEEKDLPDLPVRSQSSKYSSSQTSQRPAVLTWNTCLNQILGHEAVDPEVKQHLRERVKNSKTRNGNGDDEQLFVAAEQAGLVPNFSYPIIGSPFYDRTFAEDTPLWSLTDSLLNSLVPEEDLRYDRRSTVGSDSSLKFDFDLPNLASSFGSSSPSSSASASAISDSLYRAPTPNMSQIVERRIKLLLSEILSPSELDLCRSITTKSPCPPTTSVPPPPTPDEPSLHARLISSLYALIHHLQDRVLHLEDTLLLQLGTALERKTYTIDVLSVELRKLYAQARELKVAVDFGNNILAGCWAREYEVWRTLIEMKEKRKGGWKRWVGRKRKVSEGAVGPESMGEQMRGKGGVLKKGQIDALALMAEQNVKILREDVGDMVEMVDCFRRKSATYQGVEREEGSWRDV